MIDNTNIIQNKMCCPAGFSIMALGYSTIEKSQSGKLHLICENQFDDLWQFFILISPILSYNIHCHGEHCYHNYEENHKYFQIDYDLFYHS